MSRVFSKTSFANLIQVSRPTLSNYLRDGKIHGDALTGTGRDEMINVEVALQQLLDLDPGQSFETAKGAKRSAAVMAAIKAGGNAGSSRRQTRSVITSSGRANVERRRLVKLQGDTAVSKLEQAQNALISRSGANAAFRDSLESLHSTLRKIADDLPPQFSDFDRTVVRRLVEDKIADAGTVQL